MNNKNFLDEIIYLKENLEKDLPVLIKKKKKIKKDVFVGKNVKFEPNIFFDTSMGKIFIDDNTKIKANSILRGPLVIGKNCVVSSFTEINCSRIGDVCKIGGEIEHSFMQSYSNKQHYGFLGYSYVGSWVNIGGGTSVATLKNTYSNVKVDGIDTGMQFFGSIIKDYVKTAINTSIFCGKVIGESSHLYGIVASDVPAFTNHVSTENLYEIPIDIAIKIQKAMCARRGIEITEKDKKDFEELFKQTQTDRDKLKVKKEKLKL